MKRRFLPLPGVLFQKCVWFLQIQQNLGRRWGLTGRRYNDVRAHVGLHFNFHASVILASSHHVHVHPQGQRGAWVPRAERGKDHLVLSLDLQLRYRGPERWHPLISWILSMKFSQASSSSTSVCIRRRQEVSQMYIPGPNPTPATSDSLKVEPKDQASQDCRCSQDCKPPEW